VFVVLERDVSEAGLKAALGKSIAMRLNPLFKVHQVVTVDSLPRTASNKIMRRRLRADHAERS
jgi:acetyl-CoA synthetase